MVKIRNIKTEEVVGIPVVVKSGKNNGFAVDNLFYHY